MSRSRPPPRRPRTLAGRWRPPSDRRATCGGASKWSTATATARLRRVLVYANPRSTTTASAAALQRELEEWKAAQHELKRQYRDAMREQQRALRETLRMQQQDARRQGRRGL